MTPCSTMPSTISSKKARPSDFSKILRSGGEKVSPKAWIAASSMVPPGSGMLPHISKEPWRSKAVHACWREFNRMLSSTRNRFVNPVMPPRLSRREMLAGSAALVAAPYLVRAASGDYDVVIVGAGAAGLTAAHKIVAGGRRCIVIEAASRAGGRIASAARPSGAIYDKGANRFSLLNRNPLLALARMERLNLYDPPAGKRLLSATAKRVTTNMTISPRPSGARAAPLPRSPNSAATSRRAARCPTSAAGREPSRSRWVRSRTARSSTRFPPPISRGSKSATTT